MMAGFATTGSSGASCTCSTVVFGLRQFVAGVIDDIPLGSCGRSIRPQTSQLERHIDNGNENKRLEQPSRKHAAIGKHPNWSFASQRIGRLGKCRPNGSAKFVPGRRPLNQQLRCIVEGEALRLDHFAIEHFTHADTSAESCQVISISSPIWVPVEASVRAGSSNIDTVLRLTGAIRHGFRLCSRCTTTLLESR